MKKTLSILLTSAFLVFQSNPSDAADTPYPNRPVKIIVPFGAGGITDSILRALADGLQRELGQPMVVENVTGAAGLIGAAKAAKSVPDGYTLLFTTNVQVITPSLWQKLPYETIKDFSPLAIVGYSPNLLVVAANAPYKSVAEYVAAAKADPGALSYASAGVGTTPHFAAEQFAQITGTSYIHAPYNSTTAMVQATTAGDVKSTWIPGQPAEQFLNTHRLKALGAASKERSRYAPDAPTFEELGYKGFISETWYAFFGPANLPAPIAAQVTEAVQNLLSRPDFRNRLSAIGLDRVELVTGEAFRNLLPREIEMYKSIVRVNKIPQID